MAATTESKKSNVFEDDSGHDVPHPVHRLRANSSIMKLKKILGEFAKVHASEFSRCKASCLDLRRRFCHGLSGITGDVHLLGETSY
jgi:hypothetical protein